MLGRILRFRPLVHRPGGRLVLTLVVTAGCTSGMVLANRPSGGDREQRAAGATRLREPSRTVREIEPSPLEKETLSSTPALPAVAEPVAALTPPPPPVPSLQSESATRASSQASEPRPAPAWIASAGPLAASPPVRVDIPAIGTTAAIGPLGLNADRTLEVPTDFGRAGYYTGRPTPGETGPAIVVAHRSSRRGPGAFWRLPEVQPGQEIVITRADRKRVVFVIDRLEQYPKDAFPTEAVYGPTPETAIRLITCGGPFEPSLGDRYRDNVIVFAHMTGWAS